MFLKNSVFLHGLRVAFMSYKLCTIINIDTRIKFYVFIGSVLHDIGKFKIKKSILNKPGKLSLEEFEIIKTHTEFNFMIIKNKLIRNIILYHHENVDGSGYKGITNIPYEAKLVRICDMFDALTHNRVYHERVSSLEALKIMIEEKSNFDNSIFGVFVKMILYDKSHNPSYSSYLKESLKDVQ